MSINRRTKIALVVGGIAAAVIGIGFIMSFTAGKSDSPVCYVGSGTGGFHHWGWLMSIFMVIFWGFVIWVIISAARWSGGTRRSERTASGQDSALELLKRRYAAGEISQDEFESKKRDIA